MNLVTIVLSVLGLFTILFSFVFFKDFFANKNNLGNHNSWFKVIIIGAIINFFDTLGIGSFAPLTASLRAAKQIDDRLLPGTLNVSCTIPVVLESFIFMTVIKVDALTLVSLLAAAAIGAYIGAGIVSRLPEKKVQMTMAIALFITAGVMFAGQMKWMPSGGDALGLTGAKLGIGIIGNFILGALMTAGIGLYAPCMALVYFLGMSAKVAFPIMMGSCAFLMPVASMKFVKEGTYDRKASMGITIGAIFGVIIAATCVKNLPMDIIKWLVIAVIIYTSVTMFQKAIKKA